MSALLYVFLFICTAHYSHEIPPTVTHAEYKLKDVDILGVQMKLGIFSYTFDQELYKMDAQSCPANVCHEEANCYCDYTNVTGQCGVPSNQSQCSCSHTTDYCQNSQWTNLQMNQTVKTTTEAGTLKHFRLLVTDSCTGFQLSVVKDYGSLELYVDTNGPASYISNQWVSVHDYIVLNICPSDNDFKAGTFFIAVQTFRTASFSITATPLYVPTPSSPPSSPCVVPNELNGTHQCIDDGVAVSAQCPTPNKFYYLYKFTGCQKVFVYLSCGGQGSDMDLYGGIHDAFPYFRASDYESYLPGDDWMSLSICPPEGQNDGTLFLTVDCWQTGVDFSNFSLYVTNATKWKYTPITQLSQYDFPFAIVGSARYLKGLNDSVYSNRIICENWSFACDNFWPIFPSTEPMPFYPFPPYVVTVVPQISSVTGTNLLISAPPQSRMYSTAIILEYTVDDAVTTLITNDELAKLKIEFISKLSNSDGEPVVGSYAATQVVTECDYASFQAVKAEVDSIVDEIGSTLNPLSIQAIRFRLDETRFKSGWTSCQNLLNSLLVSEQVYQNLTSESCPVYSSSDQCCNELLQWNITCEPRVVTVPVNQPAVNSELVVQKCRNPSCSSSTLQDYEQIVQDASTDVCAASSAQASIFTTNLYTQYRNCMYVGFGKKSCYTDSDCWEDPVNRSVSCDLTSYTCMVPLPDQELAFISCLLSTMEKSQEVFIKSQYNLTGSISDPAFAMQLMAYLRSYDCVSTSGFQDFSVRGHNLLQLALSCTLSSANKCPKLICGDTSCAINEHTCYPWCGEGDWIWYDSDATQCESEIYCNWNSTLCQSESLSSCQTKCVSQSTNSSFCGYCENGQDCIEIHVSQEECGSTSVCRLPNGSIALNISDAECNSYGQCSHNCPMKCSSGLDPNGEGVCYSATTNPLACNSSGGDWNEALQVCFYLGYTPSQCDALSATFSNCRSLSNFECIQCQYSTGIGCSLDQSIMQCYIDTNVRCNSKEECNQAGACSDAGYLQDWTVTPPMYGGCLIGRILPVDDFYGLNDIPFCDQNQITIPNGCIDPYINKTACSTRGTWWEPSTNKTACTAEMGCWDLRPTIVHGSQYAFSPKNYANCTSPYNRGTWKSLFDWDQAVWITGQQRTLKWISREANSRYHWQPTLRFPSVQSMYFSSGSVKVALQSKSQVLCQYTRSADTLTTITCDCSNANSDVRCFDSIAVTPVAEGKPCSGTISTLSSPAAQLTFHNASISSDCVDVVLSQVSALYFQEASSVKLSANFAPSPERTNFAVYNDQGGTMGVLLGDATVIAAGGPLGAFTLCLKLRSLGKVDAKFSVYDFAESDMAFNTFTPIEINAVEQDGYLCAEMPSLSTNKVYFPLKRVQDWKEEPHRLYDQTTLGLMYTLAVFFTIITVAATVRLGFLVYGVIKLEEDWITKKQLLVFFIWIFNLVRGIYFWMLPNGLDTRTADYILVVLPTFFYFTAFTLIVVLWAVVTLKKFTGRKEAFTTRVNQFVLGINAAFYLLFIIIVLVFQFAAKVPELECKGRATASTDSAQETQRAISILYTVLISTISLVIGVAFLFFGPRMYKAIAATPGRSRVDTAQKKASNRKLFLITGVCAIAFILHCAFTIVIAALSDAIIVFTFLGLLFTELLPSAFILGVFWKVEKAAARSSTNSSTVQMSSVESRTSVDSMNRTSAETVTQT